MSGLKLRIDKESSSVIDLRRKPRSAEEWQVLYDKYRASCRTFNFWVIAPYMAKHLGLTLAQAEAMLSRPLPAKARVAPPSLPVKP